MKRIAGLIVCDLLFVALAFGQEKGAIQPPSFGIHFVLMDFKSAANIRLTSLSATLREKKFARIKDMSPGLALHYFQGISPHFDVTTMLSGSFLDYPRHDTVYSGEKKLLLEGDVCIRGRMFDNAHSFNPYLQIGAGVSKFQSYWGTYIPAGIGIQVNLGGDLKLLTNAQYRIPVTNNTVAHHFFYSIGVAGIISKKATRKPPASISPVFVPPSDRDHDGILDSADACPDEAGMAMFKGCPDRDGDGIPDHLDKCPQVKGVARYQGCSVPDTDGDGINDEDDKCINVPGVLQYAGCPPPVIKEDVRQKVNEIGRRIFFETGSYRLLPASCAALDTLTTILNDNPTMRLAIEGHTDNTGNTEKNLQLSRDRARAVYEYLLERGIDFSRLKFAGYGQERPVADNDTREGRAMNRRVEFRISY